MADEVRWRSRELATVAAGEQRLIDARREAKQTLAARRLAPGEQKAAEMRRRDREILRAARRGLTNREMRSG